MERVRCSRPVGNLACLKKRGEGLAKNQAWLGLGGQSHVENDFTASSVLGNTEMVQKHKLSRAMHWGWGRESTG